MHVHAGMLRRFRHIRHSATLRTVVCQAPLSMGFSRQEYWSGLPCPPPGDLPNPGANPCLWHLLHWQMGSWLLAPPGKPTVWIGEGNAVCFKRFYGLFHIFFGSRSCLFYLHEGGSWNQTSGDDRAPGQPSGSHFPLPGGPQSQESPNISLQGGTLLPHHHFQQEAARTDICAPPFACSYCPVPCSGRAAGSLQRGLGRPSHFPASQPGLSTQLSVSQTGMYQSKGRGQDCPLATKHYKRKH